MGRDRKLDTTYERLRQHIVSGDLPPGAPLVETTLANEFGVSRTPIREALSRLEQDGLIERVDRRLQVRTRSPAEILEIFEVRIVVEGAAARAAAQRYNEVDRLRMLGHLQRLEQNTPNDPAMLSAINRDLHRSIWQASHNATMLDVLDRLALHMYRLPFTTFDMQGRAESSLKEHRQLVDAILARDEDRAAELAAQHMITARRLRLEMWEQDPDILH